MKKLLITLLLSLTFNIVFSQTKYYLSIKQSEVTNYKELSSILYNIFDDMPTFEEKSNIFFLNSLVSIDENILKDKLITLGYTLIYFKKEEEK